MTSPAPAIAPGFIGSINTAADALSLAARPSARRRTLRQGVKQTEGGQDAGRVHADNRNRADDVRQEGAEITERAGNLLNVPPEA